jgi:hypothetical protein
LSFSRVKPLALVVRQRDENLDQVRGPPAMVRKVIDQRGKVTGAMLCSHSRRASPLML